MGDFLKSRLGKTLVTALVAAGLYVACDKFPKQAGALGAIAMSVAAMLPSALAGDKSKDEEAQP